MQLQIEYNRCSQKDQSCYLCKQQFEIKEAKVIVCSDRGEGYGEACPDCIAKGFTWMENRFQQLSYYNLSTRVGLISNQLVSQGKRI